MDPQITILQWSGLVRVPIPVAESHKHFRGRKHVAGISSPSSSLTAVSERNLITVQLFEVNKKRFWDIDWLALHLSARIFARWTSQLKQKFKRLATFWIRNSPTLSLVGEAIIKVLQNHLVIHYQGVQLIEVFPGMVRRDRNLLRTKFPLKGVLRVKGVKGPLSKEILFKVSLERIADHFVWSPLWLIHI